MTRYEVLLNAQRQQNSVEIDFQRQQNELTYEYQKKYIDLTRPKKKKFLGFIGGSLGDALNGIAEVAAPIFSGGALQYNQYEPSPGAQVPTGSLNSAAYTPYAQSALGGLARRLGIQPFGSGTNVAGLNSASNSSNQSTISGYDTNRYRTPGINPAYSRFPQITGRES